MRSRWTGSTVLLALAAIAVACSGCGGSASSPASHSTTAGSTSTTTAALEPLGFKPSPARMAAAVAEVKRELQGIPQSRLLLGDPNAPVTIIEYASLSCPFCAQTHRALVPKVIDRYVRTGRANLELRPVTDTVRSLDLALSAWAATAQTQGWDVAQLAFLRGSRAGCPASEQGSRLVKALGLDVKAWTRALPRNDWKLQIEAARAVIGVAHFAGAPTFLIRGRSSKKPFVVLTQPRALQDFAAAITKAQHA